MGDGSELRTGEAAKALNVSNTTVINYVKDGLLRSNWTLGEHRRIDAASVAELKQALTVPPGPERDKALEELRKRNRGETQ